MKLDKETVVKHQFWFLLGAFVLFWIISVFWDKMAAGSPIADAKKKYETATTNLNNAKRDPINVTKVLPPWQKQTDAFAGWKGEIWKKAWNLQGSMYDWPNELAKTKDMTTPDTELTPDECSHYRHKLYPAQIDRLRSYITTLLSPIELQGGFDNVFQKMKWTETPTREEMWLVQEDYWVKRELFYTVWRTMAEQAFMPAVAIDEKKEPMPKGVKQRHRYRNRNWELTLNIRENKEGALVIGGDSTIKNVHPSLRTQTLTSAKGNGIVFNLSQNANRMATPFEIRGEPLPPGNARPLSMEKDKDREDYPVLDGIDWSAKAPVYVSQAYDITDCPIRRLDQIALAYKDCRSYTWPLEANQALARLDAPPEENDPAKKKPEAGATGGGMAGMQGGMAGMAGMAGGAAGGPAPNAGGMAGMSGAPPGAPGGPGGPGGSQGAAADASDKTPNNEIERKRYLRPLIKEKTFNPPSRHLPFALTLIIEQSYLHDVLVSMANSRLRVQITQVEFHHAKDYAPQSEGDKKGGADRTRPGGIFMAPGMPNPEDMYRNSSRPPAPGSGPGPMAGGPGSMAGSPGSMAGSPGPMMGGSGQMGGMMQPSPQMFGNPPPMMQPTTGGDPRRGMPNIATLPSMKGRPPTMPPPGTGGTNTKQSAQSAPKTQDDNLIQVTIYGVAALYRRPDPPKKEQPANPYGPQQPGVQPPAGTQPPANTQPPAGNPTQPDKKQPDARQPEQKQPEQKQPEQKKPEQKQPAGKQPDAAPKKGGAG